MNIFEGVLHIFPSTDFGSLVIYTQLWVIDMIIMIKPMLVGGFNPSEKYELVSWDDYIFPSMMESHSKFHGSKPPSSDKTNLWISETL